MFIRFSAGPAGAWRMVACTPYRGEGLEFATHLAMERRPDLTTDAAAQWSLWGFTSNVRYVERSEKVALESVQAGLGRNEARRAALIPIRKSAAWWALTQEERRDIIETQSRHIADSLKYLPAIARQLHHSRDLAQPFDFLTWFEYAPEHAGEFEQLVAHLRTTREWDYVEREVDIRLERA